MIIFGGLFERYWSFMIVFECFKLIQIILWLFLIVNNPIFRQKYINIAKYELFK
jgi:hypothetical protein